MFAYGRSVSLQKKSKIEKQIGRRDLPEASLVMRAGGDLGASSLTVPDRAGLWVSISFSRFKHDRKSCGVEGGPASGGTAQLVPRRSSHDFGANHTRGPDVRTTWPKDIGTLPKIFVIIYPSFLPYDSGRTAGKRPSTAERPRTSAAGFASYELSNHMACSSES